MAENGGEHAIRRLGITECKLLKMLFSFEHIRAESIASQPFWRRNADVWNEPYLETCCRSALHRLYLAGVEGRPTDQMDGPCLSRLGEMGLCAAADSGRVSLTAGGKRRHATEVLKTPRLRKEGR